MSDRADFQQLIEDLHSGDPDRQRRALHILGDVRCTAAVPALLDLLSHRRREMRMLAIHALRRSGDVATIPALIARLSDRSAEVRRAAAHALAHMGDERALSALAGSMLSDESSYIRWEAAKALGKLVSALPAASAQVRVLPELLEALSADTSGYVRYAAAEALGKIESHEALDGLIEALLHDSNDYVRLAAAKALGKINDADAIPALIQSLNTPNMHVWHAAAEALWEMDVPAMPFVIEALIDSDEDVRRAALKAALWLSVEYDDEMSDRDDIYWSDSGSWWN
ncbi:MAG: HEAT repeat domain-containing protein [Chloroflexota bacterium]|nr:HEAT repeat domain-containing protein [Chloroflexota bacterium]